MKTVWEQSHVGSNPTPSAKISGICFMQVLFVFVMLSKGFEGRVLKNSPVDCFSAAPLRPQTGESHTLRQNKQHLLTRVLFFIKIQFAS